MKVRFSIVVLLAGLIAILSVPAQAHHSIPAFWYPDKTANLNLMVTDSATGNTVNYCILNVPNASFPVSVSAPIWSPDGKYLMVESRYATDKNKVLVVDLSNNSAFPIAENASPVGWLVSP